MIRRMIRSRYATPTRYTGMAVDRQPAVVATAVTVTALAVLNVLKHSMPSASVVLGATATAGLLAIARASGLTWAQLGLSPDRIRHGLVWGLGAIGAVGAVYLVGVALPVTRTAFLDARYQLEASDALKTALVVIPIGTVLFEEIAFRSVLWGMLKRHMSTTRTIVVSSALFGLWHILPSLDFAEAHGLGDPDTSPAATAAVVLGTVLFTAAGGAVAGELRRRSGSVLASAGMHWATNGLGVLFGLIAWRIVTS
jgi:membrane protease YdiL (CAAX protease family)